MESFLIKNVKERLWICCDNNRSTTVLFRYINALLIAFRLLGKATIPLRNIVLASPGTPLEYELSLLGANDSPTVGSLQLTLSYTPPAGQRFFHPLILERFLSHVVSVVDLLYVGVLCLHCSFH